MLRRLSVISLLLTVLVSSAVFAGGRQEADDGVANLTMWVRTPETVALLQESIERFERENPDVTVELVEFAADAYPGALQAAISGQELPDIFHVHNSVPVPQLRELNLIQELDDHFSDGFVERFDPATWWEGSTTLDGTIYAWPDRSFRRASLFMYYNKEVMEQAGLDPEAPPVTWDEFIEQASLVSERLSGEAFGLHTGFTSGWFNERVVLQLATTVADSHGVPAEHLPGRMVNWHTGTAFDTTGLSEVADFFRRLEESRSIHPDYLNTGRSQAFAQWAAGQAAFLFDGSWRLQEILREEPDLEFGVTMLPSYDGRPVLWGVEGGSQNAFAVASTSRHPSAAARLFEFLSEDYYPMLLRGAVDLTPIPELNADESLFTHPEFLDLVDLTDRGTVVLPSPVMRNPAQLSTITSLAGMAPSRPIGQTMQGFFSEDQFDVQSYFETYAAEQQEYLEDALRQAGGLDRSDWVFSDWVPQENYY